VEVIDPLGAKAVARQQDRRLVIEAARDTRVPERRELLRRRIAHERPVRTVV
jgi:hypothetical protein